MLPTSASSTPIVRGVPPPIPFPTASIRLGTSPPPTPTLSPEAYATIVRAVPARADLAALARTCRAFQRPAERALYNTLL
ncbi:hypothetical protein B0H10DRAFT_2194090, partial [Mycena sp. CBHHK59/15]